MANELGLKIINSEIVADNVAGSMGVQESTVRRYLEGTASYFDRWQIDKRRLSQHTSEEIFSLAQQGNVLIRGWGASALFRDIQQVICARVCAPMALRVGVMMERLGVKDAEAIRQEIERFDAAHAKTVRASFNIDRLDALLYHIVLNTARVPIDICVKTVCELARDPRFQDDVATRAALADKLLEIKVRAALREHIGIETDSLTVSAANGKVILGGATSTGITRAEQLVHAIEGVLEIDNRITSVPSHGRF